MLNDKNGRSSRPRGKATSRKNPSHDSADRKRRPASHGRPGAHERAASRGHSRMLWVVAVLACAVALVAGVRLTYTAFTANDFLKAVAVTGTSQDLFASDMLSPYSTQTVENPAVRSVVVDTGGDGKCSVSFRIYNCLLDDPNVFNDKEVSYTLTVSATDANGNELDSSKWSVSGDRHVDFPSTSGVIKKYTITMDADLVDNATFTVKATVDTANSPGTSLTYLAARIVPVNGTKVQAATVESAWVDGAGNIDDYDAYNLRVTVTGVEKKVLLTWNPSVVELDSHFRVNHSREIDKTATDLSQGRLVFAMSPGSEVVNFYRVGSTAPASWDAIGVDAREYTGGN